MEYDEAMGRRALRTGDLIAPLPSLALRCPLYTDHSWIPGASHYLGLFTFGVFLGRSRHAVKGETWQPHACVFDSKSMKFGWVILKHLRRVK